MARAGDIQHANPVCLQPLPKRCRLDAFLQRPLLHFGNLCVADDLITFSITDDSSCPPLGRMARLIADFDDFLGHKNDGHPGSEVL